MRIALLTQTYPPMISGAAIFVRTLAETQAAAGHQVLVLTSSDRSRAYQTEFHNLTVLRLPSFHNRLRVGQRFTLWPRQTLLKQLTAFAPDVIHAHDPFQYGWAGLEYGRRANIPALLTLHQLPG